MEIVEKDKIKFLTSEKIGVPHGFTLRFGGVSEGEYASLNVGLRRGDNVENAKKNIVLAARALSMNEKNLTLTYQTHTNNVRFVGENEIGNGFYSEWGECGVDAVVTNLRGVPLLCYSADCVPTLLYDDNKGVISAIHGGWRGTAKNIVGESVKLMCDRLESDPKDIKAAIGPAIGICCYEVSEEVGSIFAPEHPKCVIDKGNGKYMLDLKRVTQEQLEAAGLLKENIDNSNECTSCKNSLYFSHRAQNGKSGLLGGFIQLI